jgi:Flp pilus assembly protein TadG
MKGQSLVELAISLTILLFLLSGAVEFGMAFFQFVQLRDAAQEGALYGSMNAPDQTGIILRAQGASNSPIKLSTLTPTITYSGPPCEDPNANNAITVEIAYSHHIFMPFLPQIIGRNDLPLRARVTDTILAPPCAP